MVKLEQLQQGFLEVGAASLRVHIVESLVSENQVDEARSQMKKNVQGALERLSSYGNNLEQIFYSEEADLLLQSLDKVLDILIREVS